MNARLICLLASPEARALVPPEMIEGQWREIPENAEKIVFSACVADDPVTFQLRDDPFRDITLVAEPNGKMIRRESDNLSAPVWEIRRA